MIRNYRYKIYEITVEWLVHETIYMSNVKGLPDIVEFGDTIDEVLELITDSIENFHLLKSLS
jgi:predicted RNase H-like HicB family nuclease